MAKPKPFVVATAYPSYKQLLRALERNVAQNHDAESVRSLLRGLSKENRWTLSELAMTKRGRTLIARALQDIRKAYLRELEDDVRGIVRRRPKR